MGDAQRAGFDIFPDGALLTEAAIIFVMTEFGPLTVLIPCRVVYVVNEPRRFVFAYGTIPGHPERGEEQFMIEWKDTEEVVFTITSFSRPDGWIMRLGAPLARRVQVRATRSYLSTMVKLAVGTPPTSQAL